MTRPRVQPSPGPCRRLRAALLLLAAGVATTACGGSAAARAWWMFRVFGHDRVALLDGGFGKWTKEKLPTEMSAVRPQLQSFTATFTPELVRTLSDMKANLITGGEQVIDARGPGKFDGSQEDVFPFKKLGQRSDVFRPALQTLHDPQAFRVR